MIDRKSLSGKSYFKKWFLINPLIDCFIIVFLLLIVYSKIYYQYKIIKNCNFPIN